MVHLLVPAGLYFVFNLNLLELVLVLIATLIIDLDHMPFVIRRGFGYWFKTSWVRPSSRKYPLHNFLSLAVFFILSLLILEPKFFILGACFLSIALHLLWDFLEDVFIFRLGIEHWKL
jgi:hypothetical protein